jgi:hypothetical protein
MSTPALLLDYLFASALLQARLRAVVPELAPAGAVEGITELAQAMERSIQGPKAFVLWEGDTFDTSPQGQALQGRAQIVRQAWTVLLGVRHAAQADLEARNSAAGPLLSAIHKAVAGWTPAGAPRPFTRAQGRRPQYTPNVGLYPLTFELVLHL